MENFFQMIRNLSPVKLLGLLFGFLIIFSGIILMFYTFSTKNFNILYNDLDTKDSYEIIKELEANSIPYEIKNNGRQISVPEDKLLRIRMELAEKGLPNKGSIVGYEIFDKAETLGTSNFLQNVNLLRALEGELGRTISSLSVVDTARVHLVIPKRELFSRETPSPSASVMIKIRGNQTMPKDQVASIASLVASAVPGLDLGQITIIDQKGRTLKAAANPNEDETSSIISQSEDMKIAYERKLKRIIEDLIEKSVGVGRVNAEVTAEMNFDRVVTNSEIYDPEGQVVRSTQTITEDETQNEGAASNVSVANNLPNTVQTNTVPGPSAKVSKTDETVNYEITKIVKNHISEIGILKKLSIAVVVDGTYDVNETSFEVKYVPRTAEEIKQYELLIKSAVGFDEKRGDVLQVANTQFTQDLSKLKPETMTEWFKSQFASLIQTLIIALVVILVILLVIKPIALRAFEMTKSELDELSNVQHLIEDPNAIKVNADGVAEDSIEIQEAEIFAKNNTGRTINEIANKYPKETVAVIRKWIQEQG